MVMLYAISLREIVQALWVLCSQGYSRDGMRNITFCCRHDFWL